MLKYNLFSYKYTISIIKRKLKTNIGINSAQFKIAGFEIEKECSQTDTENGYY